MSIRSKNKTRAAIAAQGKHSIAVQRSNQHFYAQLVSPLGIVLAGASTQSKAFKSKLKATGNSDAAKALGAHVASILKKMKINDVAFNRSGLIYHGRVAAFVAGLREQGVKV